MCRCHPTTAIHPCASHSLPFPTRSQVEPTASHDHLNASIRPEFRAEEAAFEYWYRAYWKAKRLNVRVGTQSPVRPYSMRSSYRLTVLVFTVCSSISRSRSANRRAAKTEGQRQRTNSSTSWSNVSLHRLQWRLATLGWSHARAGWFSDSQQAKQTKTAQSKARKRTCQVSFDSPPPSRESGRYPPHPHRASYSRAGCTSDSPAAVESAAASTAFVDRHLLPYGRMITSH